MKNLVLFLFLPLAVLIGCAALLGHYRSKLREHEKKFAFHISDLLISTFCISPTVASVAWLTASPDSNIDCAQILFLFTLALTQITALYVTPVNLILYYDEIRLPWKSGCSYAFFTLLALLTSAIVFILMTVRR